MAHTRASAAARWVEDLEPGAQLFAILRMTPSASLDILSRKALPSHSPWRGVCAGPSSPFRHRAGLQLQGPAVPPHRAFPAAVPTSSRGSQGPYKPILAQGAPRPPWGAGPGVASSDPGKGWAWVPQRSLRLCGGLRVDLPPPRGGGASRARGQAERAASGKTCLNTPCPCPSPRAPPGPELESVPGAGWKQEGPARKHWAKWGCCKWGQGSS